MKSILPTLALAASTAMLLACGSSDDGSVPSPIADEPADETPEPTNQESNLLDGILTGTLGTMPCDQPLDSGYLGDELCILPVDSSVGAFFHAGPDDYDDPDQVEPFLMAPGDEKTEYYITESSNENQIWFRDQHFRMRPGSHHLIMYQMTVPEGGTPPEIGWYDLKSCSGGEAAPGEACRSMPWGGSQTSAMDFPELGQVAPEDENLVRPLDAKSRLAFELHYVNPTSDPILREAWVNLMHNDVPVESRVILGAPFLIGSRFEVPPGATQVLNYQYTMPAGETGTVEEIRMVSFFGHRHASTPRFSIWLNRDGARDLVYEDYDWTEAKEFFYNSVIENPLPDPATATAGAASGQLFIRSGDVIEWECEMVNTHSEPLTFGDGVYTKEMCNVFGTLAPLTFGAPAFLLGRSADVQMTTTTL